VQEKQNSKVGRQRNANGRYMSSLYTLLNYEVWFLEQSID
jgi:hypothetical protein